MKRARRGRGEGGVYHRKDGMWRGTVSLGWDENGRRRRREVYARTKAELLSKLNAIAPGPDSASAYDAQRISLKEHLERWLGGRTRLREKTRDGYERAIRLHLGPSIGTAPLGSVTSTMIEAFMSRLYTKGIGARTCEIALQVLRAALRHAVRKRLLGFNPADDVQAPRSERPELQTWTAQQSSAFLEAASADRLHAMFVLALTTGMRQGELLGLRRADVDLEGRYLSIARQGDASPTKTRASRRRVELTDGAVLALRRHFDAIDADGIKSVLAFPSNSGTVWNPRNVIRRHFDTTITRANEKLVEDGSELRVPRIQFHGLRHTFATLLLARGVHPKVVAEMLGHTSIRVTLDTYSHLIPTMQRSAVDAMESLVTPREDRPAAPSQRTESLPNSETIQNGRDALKTGDEALAHR